MCFVCRSNTGECQTPISDAWNGNINEYMPNLPTMVFWRCNNSKTEIWGLSEGKNSPLIAQLYNNTQIVTLLKWIRWYCIDKTGDGQMQISCGTVWSYSATVTLFLYKKPTCKTIDWQWWWCCYRESNALWVLTSINQETITDTSICPEK